MVWFETMSYSYGVNQTSSFRDLCGTHLHKILFVGFQLPYAIDCLAVDINVFFFFSCLHYSQNILWQKYIISIIKTDYFFIVAIIMFIWIKLYD